MEDKKLFNGRYTLICQGNLDNINLPDYIDVYNDSNTVAGFKINQFQINNDIMYNGHFLFKSYTDIINFNFDFCIKLPLTDVDLYVMSLYHHGEYLKCDVGDNIMFVDPWALPAITTLSRTPDTMYGTIMNHRLSAKVFPFISLV
jgi:hypothetical protein